jgi:hypothetical protein
MAVIDQVINRVTAGITYNVTGKGSEQYKMNKSSENVK